MKTSIKFADFVKSLELENETVLLKKENMIFPAVKAKYYLENGFDDMDVDKISVENGILVIVVKDGPKNA